MNTSIKSILLVDDDLDDQIFFQEALKVVNGNIDLITARNGIDAIEKLRVNIPDIILLDLNMPQMNGVDCLRELKRDAMLATIPVVIYSSFISTCDKVEVSALGARQFLRKPISFSETVQTIRQMLTSNINDVFSPMYIQPKANQASTANANL